MFCLITQHELGLILRRQLTVPPKTHTLIFAQCQPYEFPYYQTGDDREALVFPEAKRVVFYWNEKYFQDKWVHGPTFPNVTEMWISNVCGGFFDYKRPSIRYYVPKVEAAHRGFPKEHTTTMETLEWDASIHALGLPEDLGTQWDSDKLNPKYIGEDGINIFFHPSRVPKEQ